MGHMATAVPHAKSATQRERERQRREAIDAVTLRREALRLARVQTAVEDGIRANVADTTR
jgi:hypothetical protein